MAYFRYKQYVFYTDVSKIRKHLSEYHFKIKVLACQGSFQLNIGNN